MAIDPATLSPWERYQYYMGQYAHAAPTSQAVTAPGAQPTTGPGNPLVAALVLKSLTGGGAAEASAAGAPIAAEIGNIGGAGAMGEIGGVGGAGSLAEVPGAFSMNGIGAAGNALLPLAGTVGIADVLMNQRKGARGIGQGAASGAAIGSYFGPWGTGIGAGVGGLLGLANGFMDRESTRDRAKRHTAELAQRETANSVWQNYLKGMRDQYNSGPPDPSKPFAGKYGSWNEYKAAGLDAADLTGVYGNLKVYGPEFAALTFDQRKALTQKNIDAGNYDSRKGEVVMLDEAKGKQIWDEFQKGLAKPAASTRKDSPGFKDGKRINYGGR